MHIVIYKVICQIIYLYYYNYLFFKIQFLLNVDIYYFIKGFKNPLIY